MKYIEEMFCNIGFDKVADFALAQVADSTALNPKIAKLLKIIHIACRNHCLNLACRDMEKHDEELGDLSIVSSVHELMDCPARRGI